MKVTDKHIDCAKKHIKNGVKLERWWHRFLQKEFGLDARTRFKVISDIKLQRSYLDMWTKSVQSY